MSLKTYLLKGVWRHWVAGQLVYLRDHVAAYLREQGLIDGDADKPAKAKRTKKAATPQTDVGE